MYLRIRSTFYNVHRTSIHKWQNCLLRNHIIIKKKLETIVRFSSYIGKICTMLRVKYFHLIFDTVKVFIYFFCLCYVRSYTSKRSPVHPYALKNVSIFKHLCLFSFNSIIFVKLFNITALGENEINLKIIVFTFSV